MKRVLIVEDYFALADVESLLCTMEGYDVRVARTGDEGLTHFREFHPDLVLLDLGLPGDVDGHHLLETIQTEAHGTKVLVVSGRLDSTTLAGLEGMTGVETLSKPFKPNDLAARIQAIFAAAGDESAVS